MILTFIKFMVVAALSYSVGFFVGRWYAGEEIKKTREEMGIDEEKEEDPYDVFYEQ